MRVFKLARSWKQLNLILRTIMVSVQSVGWLSCLLLLFVFIFALMGMQLFGDKFTSCGADNSSKSSG